MRLILLQIRHSYFIIKLGSIVECVVLFCSIVAFNYFSADSCLFPTLLIQSVEMKNYTNAIFYCRYIAAVDGRLNFTI